MSGSDHPSQGPTARRLSRRALLTLSVGAVGSLAGCTVPFLGGPEPPDCTGDQITELPAPASGPEEAPVTVAIYTDFDCPHCRDFFTETYPTVRDRIPTNKARFVHHDFPIPVSEWSYPVANAARAVQNARSEAAFWDFSERAYRHESEYSTAVLEELARKTKTDPEIVRRASEQLPYCQLLKQEREHGRDRGVEGTPTVFVNDQKLEAPSADELTAAITDP
ncbi:thioredoxin domain-containing protein [Halocatena pleomorpha]|uniref:DsbA family protein n=1 Tax=Halocatena pleomorpha TaxID=1785090 RepID=A0A3P3RL50_9EURY|nr:thioredoxin domain-containing protein [Halocatena pleomorpha]RRJ33590.1 DsbA family protein [Halocatena pleomorpha]